MQNKLKPFRVALLMLMLGACNAIADPYSPAKMDLKPRPAVVSQKRHTGAYSAGSALSLTAELKPLDPAPIKEVRIDTTHKLIEIAAGVKFSAWTFGGQVPGPTVRAKVGDTIRFSMSNRSDEPAPGVEFTAAPMMHLMDFHAAMVSPQTSTARLPLGKPSTSSSRPTTRASSCITVARPWFWSTSLLACTAR